MKVQFNVTMRDGSRMVVSTPYNGENEQQIEAAYDYVYYNYPEAVYVELI